MQPSIEKRTNKGVLSSNIVKRDILNIFEL